MFTQTEKMVTNQIPLHNERVGVIFTTIAPFRPLLRVKPYVYGASNFSLRPSVPIGE